MSGWTVVIVFLVTAIASTVFWYTAPKENRTYVEDIVLLGGCAQLLGGTNKDSVWRSSVILTLAMCYLMWAITYLYDSGFGILTMFTGQLHPLVAPRRSDMRPEFAE